MKAAGVMVLLLSLALPGYATPLDVGELMARTQAPAQLQGRFSQYKYLKVLDAGLESSGQFSYRRGEEIRWQTQQPLQSELIMTPQTIESRQHGETLLQLDSATQPLAQLLSTIFFSVMTADWLQLTEYFQLSGQALEGERWQVTLTPLHAEIAMVVTQVELQGDSLLRQVVLHDAVGDITTIRFDGLTR